VNAVECSHGVLAGSKGVCHSGDVDGVVVHVSSVVESHVLCPELVSLFRRDRCHDKMVSDLYTFFTNNGLAFARRLWCIRGTLTRVETRLMREYRIDNSQVTASLPHCHPTSAGSANPQPCAGPRWYDAPR